MSGPELVFEHVQTASNDLRDAAGALRTERQAVARQFRACAGGDWTGAAATSFLEYFEQWDAGLTDVEEGLAAMAELVDATRRDFLSTEDTVTGSLNMVAARLVDRLGG
jgi:WXG100 family type VII secretion target